MHRFFVRPGAYAADRLAIPDEIRHQLRSVLRARPGTEILLLDGSGTQAHCRLVDDGALEVVERGPASGEPRHRLTICQAVLKSDHLEEVIRSATEIGVVAVRLIISERTIVRSLSEQRLARLRSIAREAAEQSERGAVPDVHAPVSLRSVLGPDCVVLYERTGGHHLAALPPPHRMLIGPEGGLTAAEVEAATAAGSPIAWLGPRILRSEHVALAAAAVVLSAAGEFA